MNLPGKMSPCLSKKTSALEIIFFFLYKETIL
jgi:hypothetical protein